MTASINNPGPTQRDQLEYALTQGAAIQLAADPSKAQIIAEGIKNFLDALHPQPVLYSPHTGAARDPRDVASDPQAILCMKPGGPLKAAAIAASELSPSAQADQRIEAEIQAKGKTAPRVTPADVEANIASEHYFTADDGAQGAFLRADKNFAGIPTPTPLRLLTFCILVLKNGFTVTGESACASPENFDAEIGRKIARENAVQKIWPLMGYELRSKLAG